ncbi:MAG TPA: 5-formyltetrahydrofolate cyclo-ligase [Balneolaceae bacterium]|nr:5-formyltetrahydrofolate cyclo-ligase [Balneolaceae bacterium]
MDKGEQKQRIRKKMLEQRSGIPEHVFLKDSARILGRLKEISEFRQAEVIHCYVSINRRREVNTHPFIKEMLAAGKKVVVPVTKMESKTLRHVRLHQFDELRPNSWGGLEPAGGNEVSISQLQLIIVPMVAGDLSKNRIGYGEGFYDRFLRQVNCPTAGLLFEQCLIPEIPVESFDVPLSMLITENKIIR